MAKKTKKEKERLKKQAITLILIGGLIIPAVAGAIIQVKGIVDYNKSMNKTEIEKNIKTDNKEN